jgi:hypothetical protein
MKKKPFLVLFGMVVTVLSAQAVAWSVVNTVRGKEVREKEFGDWIVTTVDTRFFAAGTGPAKESLLYVCDVEDNSCLLTLHTHKRCPSDLFSVSVTLGDKSLRATGICGVKTEGVQSIVLSPLSSFISLLVAAADSGTKTLDKQTIRLAFQSPTGEMRFAFSVEGGAAAISEVRSLAQAALNR